MQTKRIRFTLLLLSYYLYTASYCPIGWAHNGLSQLMERLRPLAPHLQRNVLRGALHAYQQAKANGLDQQGILTIINYSRPDYQKRLWTFDLQQPRLLFHTWVAHGRHSGDVYARHFSNRYGSKETSLGLYRTGHTYYGHHGYSLRLHGLSDHFNDHAYQRHIVLHGAWYVGQAFVERHHRLGRSWGCLAVSRRIVKKVIDALQGGTLIFAYAAKPRWLHHGPYVRGH